MNELISDQKHWHWRLSIWQMWQKLVLNEKNKQPLCVCASKRQTFSCERFLQKTASINKNKLAYVLGLSCCEIQFHERSIYFGFTTLNNRYCGSHQHIFTLLYIWTVLMALFSISFDICMNSCCDKIGAIRFKNTEK